MADKKISQLPLDGTVTGTELLTGVDSGNNVNVSVNQIVGFVVSKILEGGAPGQILSYDSNGALAWIDAPTVVTPQNVFPYTLPLTLS